MPRRSSERAIPCRDLGLGAGLRIRGVEGLRRAADGGSGAAR
jgi:hypothetical protein